MTTYRCWSLDDNPDCEDGPLAVEATGPAVAAEVAAERWYPRNDFPAAQRVRVTWGAGREHDDYVVTAEQFTSFSAELVAAPEE